MTESNGEIMTNEQFDKTIKMVIELAKKCKTTEELIEALEKITK